MSNSESTEKAPGSTALAVGGIVLLTIGAALLIIGSVMAGIMIGIGITGGG